MSESEFRTIRETCEEYGISRTTFYLALEEAGDGMTISCPPYRFVDRQRFREWVDEHRPAWLHPTYRAIRGRMSEGTRAAKSKMRAANKANLETARRLVEGRDPGAPEKKPLDNP